MSVMFIDTETLGLAGPARLIQWALDDGAPKVLRLPRFPAPAMDDESSLADFLKDLAQAETLVWYNLPFDLPRILAVAGWSALQKKQIDLQIHAQTKSILAPIAHVKAGARAVAKISRIPRECAEAVIDFIKPKILAHLPPGVEVSVSRHEVPRRPGLVTLSFTCKTRVSLKNLMKSYGVSGTADLDETGWPLPKDEDPANLTYQVPHSDIEDAAHQVLIDPAHPFYSYARNDIVYTRTLYRILKVQPNEEDACAAAVAATRFAGIPLDHGKLRSLFQHYRHRIKDLKAAIPFNPASPPQRLEYFQREFPGLASTGKKVLQKIRKFSPVADALIQIGELTQRLNQVKRLRRQVRGTPDFRVFGTATGRMAGGSGLNWQGIAGDKDGIRSAVLFKMVGDFSTLEVVIAATAYKDPVLLADLQSGMDLHLFLACKYHPGLADIPYEEALPRKKEAHIDLCRKQMKAVVFGSLYGAQAKKIAETVEMDEDTAQGLLDGFWSRYSAAAETKARIDNLFITADTDGWILDSVERMEESITDLLGFVRKFSFEKAVANTLWRSAKAEIPALPDGKIVRREDKGVQTFRGAVSSALLGGALTIQKAVARQAGNSIIQSVGARLTKILMARLFEAGALLMQVHDEICIFHLPEGGEGQVHKITEDFLEEYRPIVPLLNIKFENTERWSDK